MKLLPYRKLTFHSPLKTDEIRNRLYAVTRPHPAYRRKYYPNLKAKDYTGDVFEYNFTMRRNIGYTNSFLPHLKGKMEASGGGTTITITMRLHLMVMIFGCVFFAAILFSLLYADFDRLSLFGGDFPLVVVIGFVLMFTIPFWIEANIAQKDLSRIFECQPE